MITDEQLKSLKPGDAVLVAAKVNSVKETGVDVTHGCISHTLPFNELYPVPEQPKHNPYRKFQEGDIVDYCRRYGRDYETVPDPEDYKIARVFSAEEEESGMVGVEFVEAYGGDNVCFLVPWFHLELVTPVEELEPYSVHESEVIQGFDIVRDKSCVMTFPFGEKENGWYYNRPAAKAAAEAERDRLNAEWKKLQI